MSRIPLIVTLPLMALAGACSGGPGPRPGAPESPPATVVPAVAPDAAASTSAAASDTASYRCDHDIRFTVRFGDDSAEIDAGARGTQTLQRDAGGVTPTQTVYSSTAAKVEFGLDPQGRGAQLHWVDPPLEASCVREQP